MANKSLQIAEGTVVGIWTVVSSAPVRINGILMWRCRCEAGHERDIPHHDLQFGVAPTQCVECVQQAATQRAQERIEEKKLGQELARQMLEQHRKEAQPVQIKGLAEPGTPLGHIRSIQVEQVAQQQERQETAA